jgi:hypothetical protein
MGHDINDKTNALTTAYNIAIELWNNSTTSE